MSIFAWYGYEGSLIQRAKTLKKAGFSSLSLWWEREDNKSPDENLETLRSLGIKTELIHMPYFPGGLWGGEQELFEKAFLSVINELHKAEISLAVFHPTTFEELELPVSEMGLEIAYRLFCRAKEMGISLVAENLQRDPHLFSLLEYFNSNNL